MKNNYALVLLIFIALSQFANTHAQESWSIAWTGNCLHQVYDAQFSLDGSKVGSCDASNQIRLWNTNDGSLIWSYTIAKAPTFVRISFDGKVVASGSSDGNIYLLDALTGGLLKTFNHDSQLSSLEFSPDGKKILSAGGFWSIKLWDISSGTCVWTSNLSNASQKAFFNNDGTKIVSSDWGNTVQVWDSATGNLLLKRVFSNSICAVTFSPDGTKIACGFNGALCLIDTKNSNVLWNADQPLQVTSIRFSPDGTKIVSGGGGDIREWRTDNGSLIWKADNSNYPVDYSPNGNRIVSAGYLNAIKLRDAKEGTLLWTGSHSDGVTSLHFSPDGRKILSGSYDHTIKLWQNDKKLQLNTFNTNGKYKTNSIQSIKWTSDKITSVKLEYTIDNGKNWLVIKDSIAASSGMYNWRVPKIVSQQCKIRISDIKDEYTNAEGDALFEIYKPIGLVNPSGGELFQAGTVQEIKWIKTAPTFTNIQYSIDNGNKWEMIINNVSPTDSVYKWLVPNKASSQFKIRVSDYLDSNSVDETPTAFEVYQGLAVNSPNGGEILKANRIKEITWKNINSAIIRIHYSTDQGTSWIVINDSVSASNGRYSWIIPAVTSTNCKIKVTDNKDSNIYDVSDSTFSIIQPTIIVTCPTGGEIWMVRTKQDITWLCARVDNVKLEYTTDDGASWVTIVENMTANSRKYNWTIPDIVTNKCRVRISDVADKETIGQSSGTFFISPFVGIDTEENNSIPIQYALKQNYPNPFNPTTTINYQLPKEGMVTIKVYDVLGKEVATLVNEQKSAGYYKIDFDASSFTSGVYICSIQANNFNKSIKLLLTK